MDASSQRSSTTNQLKGRGLFLKMNSGNNVPVQSTGLTTRSGSANLMPNQQRLNTNVSIEDANLSKPAKLFSLGRSMDPQNKMTPTNIGSRYSSFGLLNQLGKNE